MTTAAGPPVRSSEAPDRTVPECPYVGLVPFDEKDAAYFFGRERESALIVANLTASRLTLLYAPSGVGKSSVLRAGVLPALHCIDDDSYDDLGIPGAAVAYVSTWRDAPLESVAAAVSAAVAHVTGVGPMDAGPMDAGAMDAGAMGAGASAPTLSVAWLREVLRQSRVSTIYLILDQFEEYFLYHPADRGREGLTTELGRILSARDLPVHVLLSIREDSLAGLDRFKGRVPHLFDNYLRLAHLNRNAARVAIEGPLDRYNQVVPPDRRMSIEPGLIVTLLDQVRTGHVRVAPEGPAPDGFAPEGLASDGSGSDGSGSDGPGAIETPYLQLVLTRLWDQERATGSSSLRRSTLDELGGAQTIVQSHLDNVMSGLSPAQVEVAAAVFRNLVTTSGAKIALTAEDLADLSGLPVSAVRDVLETLCSGPQRILRPLPPAVGVAGPLRYEIFHDVMGAAVLDWRRRYVTQRHQAESSRRLIAEREEAQAAARIASRRLRLTVVFAVMTLVIGALGALTYIGYRSTQQQKLQFLLLQSATTLVGDPAGSLKQAVDAYNITANDDTREAVLIAASSPRSRVVVGPNPMMAGMVLTPDSRHVVAYDTRGGIRVIGDNGAVEHEITASVLRGTVIRSPRAAAVSPDASQVVLGTDQGTVAIIDTATGGHRDIDTPGGSTPAVSWIGSAANGLVLVVAGNVATTYSPDTGTQVARFPGVVNAVPLDDERHIVTSGEDGKLRVRDARTAVQSAESSPLAAAPRFLTRYGQSVVGVVEGKDSSIVVWNGHAGSDPAAYPVQFPHMVQRVSVGERAGIISIGDGKEVWTYSLRNGSLQGRLPQQADWIYDMETSPDSQWLTTASVDGDVRVWSLGHQRYPSQPTYELRAHHGPVRRARYLREGNAVMSLGKDGMIRYWELPQVPRFDQHTDWVVGMNLSRDGSRLATASADGQIFIIDPHDVVTAPVGTVSTRPGLRDMFFDPTDPHRIVTLVWGAPGSAPELWRWGGEGKTELLQTYAIPPLPESEPLLSLAISPDGTMVAGGDNRGTVHFWDARTGALRADRWFRGAGQPATAVRFDPSGQLLATADQYGVRLWKLGTAEPLALLLHPNAGWVAFDPSGKHLASAARDGTVKIWTREGKLYKEFAAHGHLSSSPSFSGDGTLLAVGTADGLVEIRDVQSGRTVMLDRHHGASVNSVAFLPGDPSRLISASDDTTVAQFSCPACTDPDGVIRKAVEWAKGH